MSALDQIRLNRVRLFAEQLVEESRMLDDTAQGEAAIDSAELVRAAKVCSRLIERMRDTWVTATEPRVVTPPLRSRHPAAPPRAPVLDRAPASREIPAAWRKVLDVLERNQAGMTAKEVLCALGAKGSVSNVSTRLVNLVIHGLAHRERVKHGESYRYFPKPEEARAADKPSRV